MISPIRNEDLVLKVIPSEDLKKQIEKYDAFLDLIFDEEYYFLREAAYNILYFLFSKSYLSISDLVKENDPSREGYVLRFSNGYRVKVKFEEYCRLHKIITNVSNVDIWEKLKDNLPLDEILDKVPDEFYGWVKKTENDLRERFQDIIEESEERIYSIKKKLGDSERRIYAEEIKKEKNPGVLFNLLDGRSPDQIIWKLVRPKWSKPFKEDN
jgi:RNA ligase